MISLSCPSMQVFEASSFVQSLSWSPIQMLSLNVLPIQMFRAQLKAPYSSNIDIFFLSKKGLITIYGINTIIKCGI